MLILNRNEFYGYLSLYADPVIRYQESLHHSDSKLKINFNKHLFENDEGNNFSNLGTFLVIFLNAK